VGGAAKASAGTGELCRISGEAQLEKAAAVGTGVSGGRGVVLEGAVGRGRRGSGGVSRGGVEWRENTGK
jgi:hypothetical protein